MDLHRASARSDRLFRNIVSSLAAAFVCAASLNAGVAGSRFASAMALQTPTTVSLTLSPTMIAGGSGGTSTGTVTLSAPAPAGGAVVTLTSSNVELAATLLVVTVPAGATSATFAVATNARYRAYSGLAFNATISATYLGAAASATLNVTAQARPPDFSSGSQAGANTQWDGLMCGGIPPIGGAPGILYQCSPAAGTGFGSCTFREECSLGCRRVPPNGRRFNDVCATGGPNPVALSRNYIASGDRVPATIVAEAPAGQGQDQEQGVPGVIDQNFNASYFPHAGGIGFPTGATSVRFDVATSYVPAIQFADVVGFWFNASIPPFLITNGRAGHAWLVMLPPHPPPAVARPTLGDFRITGLNPITGGETTIGQIDLSGLARVGGPTITLTSSHPAIVPSMSVEAPASQSLFGFQVFIQTAAPAATTDVTITASDGRYSFSGALTVLKPPPPAVLSGVSVEPTSVIGGNPVVGTVTLSGAQSGATVVGLSTPAPASVATMPASVTVPAGATSASFVVNTSPVASQFNMNIFADLAGSPGRQALLLITPGGGGSQTPAAPTLVSPASDATGVAQPVTLDWNDVANASSYEVQVDTTSTIAAPFAANPTVTVSQATVSGLPAQPLWWRVRARNAAGVFGPFSSVRRFTPGAAAQTVTLSVTATGRRGERVSSSPAGIDVRVGSSGAASFSVGTAVTLSVSNGRSAIWSGACSSGGSRRRTCTFTLNGNGAVTANVQ